MHEAIVSLDEDHPVRIVPWPTYDKGYVVIGDEEVDAALRTIKSRRLFRYDNRPLAETEVGSFELELAAFFGVKHALAVSSGTAALAVSLFALGIKAGDEVLCSAFGFPASPSSIVLTGATPILFEVDENLHPDLVDLEKKITNRTKAVLIIHMRGQSGDIAAVADLCGRYGLSLIEDAVPTLGARFKGRYLGIFGTVGAFSTQSDKSLNTGEGGFLLTNDSALFERAVALSGAYEGLVGKHCDWPPTTDYLRLPLFNFRMDEIRGAIGRAQLKKLPARIEVLRRNYERVSAIIGAYPELLIRKSFSDDATLGDSVVFRVNSDDPSEVFRLSEAIRSEGIDARYFGPLGGTNVRVYWTWKFLFPSLSVDEIRRVLPNTTRWLDQTIDIPLSPLLTDRDINDLELAVGKSMSRWRKERQTHHL